MSLRILQQHDIHEDYIFEIDCFSLKDVNFLIKITNFVFPGVLFLLKSFKR